MIIHSLLPHSISSLLCIELFQSLSCKEHLSTVIDKVIPFLNRSACVFKHSVHMWPLKVGLSEAFEMESAAESCGFLILLHIAEEQLHTEGFILPLRHTHTPAFIFHLHWHLCIRTWAITLWHSHPFIKVEFWVLLCSSKKIALNIEKYSSAWILPPIKDEQSYPDNQAIQTLCLCNSWYVALCRISKISSYTCWK